MQVETVRGMENLEAIAQTPGVDAVFIGPSDLSASMGLPGQLRHPDVIAAIHDIIDRMRAIGVPVGLMELDSDTARGYVARGSTFTAVGIDLILLASAVDNLRNRFRDT